MYHVESYRLMYRKFELDSFEANRSKLHRKSVFWLKRVLDACNPITHLTELVDTVLAYRLQVISNESA